MVTHYDTLIVGAGHGGAQAAISLRQRQYKGSIAIIGEEPGFPYERPPLSKDYLLQERTFEQILIRPENFWAEQEITLLSGLKVTEVNAQSKIVTTYTGATYSYSSLIWAAGCVPRKLPCRGADLKGVHTIRRRDDIDRITAQLGTTNRVVIIGGGYIGLEAASAFVELGKNVTVLEAQERVLSRVTGTTLSRFFEDEHRAHGVDVRLDVAIESIEGSNGSVSAVRLISGEVLPADLVIVGIGITPAIAPVIGAGAAGINGVLVDAQCRTSLPGIYAVGDCALHVNGFSGGNPIRLESVQNANDMADTVAKNLTGTEDSYSAVPWFWSEQYNLRLQTVGLFTGYDEEVIRGNPAERSFSIIYLKQGKVIALDCINSSKDYIQGKSLVNTGARLEPSQLKDKTLTLKEIASMAHSNA